MAGQIPLDQLPKGFAGSEGVLIGPSPQQGGSGDGSGNFRNYCDYSHMSYDDPIVYPGQRGAAHLHSFFGNTGTDALSTHDSLLNSGNGTCSGGIANRSAYWVPSLMDGNNRPIEPTSALIYYKNGEVPARTIKEIPPGLRIVAGDSKAATGQPDNVARFMGCGWSPYLLDCGTGGTIWMSISFPQCWNGTDLDSPDHKSHMAYVPYGKHKCPAGYPVALPQLEFNVFWIQPPGGYQGLKLASDPMVPGARAGQTMHADFMEAWQPAVRATWTQHCVVEERDCTRGLGDSTMLNDPPGMTV